MCTLYVLIFCFVAGSDRLSSGQSLGFWQPLLAYGEAGGPPWCDGTQRH